MALPLIAAGIVARAAVKKLATRAAGGITGAGAKSVGSVYREQGFGNAVLKQPSYTPSNSLSTGPVKINSNPNTTAAKGKRNPTQTKLDREERMDPVYDKYGNPPKKTMHINSNPKRGK
jgi:hypothetical protein